MELKTKYGIRKANLVGCLEAGIIDWFQFFEGWRAVEDEERKEKALAKSRAQVVLWVTDGNTGKKAA